MRVTKALIWTGAILSALLVAGSCSYVGGAVKQTRVEVATAAAKPEPAAVPNDITSPSLGSAQTGETSSGVSPGRPSERLLQEFAASTNLRAFALSARGRPSEGGHFYARYVANLCGRDYAALTKMGNAALKEEIRTTGTVPAYRIDLMQDLPRRCSSFILGETGSLVADLKDRSGSSGDPLLSAERELIDAWKSRRPELLRAAVQRLMQIDDPLLWTEHRLQNYVTQADPEARKATGFYLGGRVYSATQEQDLHEASFALELGFCKPDLPCALDDELRIACAGGGDCARDRYEKSKAQYLENGGTEEGWRRVMALVDRIQAALRAGNVSMFVR